MNRIHAFEFNDQSWLPQFMTSWMTSVLHVSHRQTEDGRVWAPKVLELMRKCGQRRIVDLCSGGGGPVLDLVRILEKEYSVDVHLTLTDLIPNLRSAAEINKQGPNRVYITRSMSATNVPNDWQGVRTVFSGFHHLRPANAFNLLKNAFDNRQYLFVGETTKRSLRAIRVYSKAPIHFFAATKLINPTLAQRVCTFAVPVLPLMLGWDNVMSCLRTYSSRELTEFTRRLNSRDYQWEMGELYNPVLDTPYPYIMGYPT